MSKHKIVQEEAEKYGWVLDSYESETVRRKDPITGDPRPPETLTRYHFTRDGTFGCLVLFDCVDPDVLQRAVEVEVSGMTEDARMWAEGRDEIPPRLQG